MNGFSLQSKIIQVANEQGRLLNLLDAIIAVLFVVGVALGYHRGLISQLVSIAGLFIAYLLAYQFYGDFAPWVRTTMPLTSFSSYDKYEFVVEGLNLDVYLYNAVAFALIFFGVKLGLSIAGRLLNLVAKAPGIHVVNKWSGAVLACIEVLFIVIIAVNVMKVMPSDKVQKLLSNSAAAPVIIEKAPSVAARLQHLWNKEE